MSTDASAAPRHHAQVLPLLQMAGVQVTLTLTERRGHATEAAARLDLASVDALLVVSGDGLLSEVYAGLMLHAQRAAAALLPLGIVPAGSGNAVAKSLAARAGEACTPCNATLAALCCSAPLALDAALVSQPGARPMHALLSLSWALVADVDIESEALRVLGSARFTLQALLRCLLLRRYAGKLLFLPPPGAAASILAGRPATAEEAVHARSLGAAAADAGSAPEEHVGWRVLDGPLESVWALNLPWGGEDALAAPDAQPGDGCFDVVVFHGGSPLAVAAALIAFESGEHVSHTCVTMVKATSFVLEPGAPQGGGAGGVIVLDGELVARRVAPAVQMQPLAYAPLHVRVLQGAARVLARPPCVAR
jgi:sphingosine kinase